MGRLIFFPPSPFLPPSFPPHSSPSIFFFSYSSSSLLFSCFSPPFFSFLLFLFSYFFIFLPFLIHPFYFLFKISTSISLSLFSCPFPTSSISRFLFYIFCLVFSLPFSLPLVASYLCATFSRRLDAKGNTIKLR